MKQVIIVNDILGGCLGESKVFWNYMLDAIPNIKGVDWSVVGQSNFTDNARSYINANCDKDAIIIQNATFIGNIDSSRYTIAFLQDNLRGMGRRDFNQEHTLSSANLIVANSKKTAESYPEYNCEIIPIGIDSNLFSPKNKIDMRTKYNIPLDKTVGIFVGAFNDVKGWDQVRKVIESRSEVYFILVSKFPNDQYNSNNTKMFNVANQDTLSELYGCSDFFILGSPVETQCLAALEASFSGLPVIMNNTGIYMDWSDKDSLGVFGEDFSVAIDKIAMNSYDTRSVIMNKGLSIQDMISKWIELLTRI